MDGGREGKGGLIGDPVFYARVYLVACKYGHKALQKGVEAAFEHVDTSRYGRTSPSPFSVVKFAEALPLLVDDAPPLTERFAKSLLEICRWVLYGNGKSGVEMRRAGGTPILDFLSSYAEFASSLLRDFDAAEDVETVQVYRCAACGRVTSVKEQVRDGPKPECAEKGLVPRICFIVERKESSEGSE